MRMVDRVIDWFRPTPSDIPPGAIEADTSILRGLMREMQRVARDMKAQHDREMEEVRKR